MARYFASLEAGILAGRCAQTLVCHGMLSLLRAEPELLASSLHPSGPY